MPNPSDSSSEYSSDSEEEVLSDNIDIESNDGNHIHCWIYFSIFGYKYL